MRNSTRLFFIISLAIACSISAPVFSQDATHEIILISTNDVHGRIDNFSRMAAYVKSLKKSYPDVFILNAGDLINGNPVVDEAKEKGYPMIDIMNDIPYDVSCPGNHEFENGEEILSRRIRQSTSIYLAANMTVDNQSPIRPLKPYTLLHASDGTTLAILGLTTNSSNPCLLHHVSISDPVRTALQFKGLRNDSTVFIALTHIGYTRDSVLATNMKELDVIIGGHSHTEIPHGLMVNGVLITQTGDKLRYIGKTVLTIKDHKVIGKTFEMIDLAQLTDKDAAVQAKIDAYDRNNSFGETVGTTATGFKNKEELGDLKADAIAEMLHLDIAFDHPRNISFSELPKGNITRGDIYQMDPYDYKIIRYDLTPADIRALIGRSLDKGKKQMLLVSGITYTLAATSSGDTSSVILKGPNGPLDEHKRYSVGVNSYIACQFMPGIDGGVQQNATSEDLLIRYLAIHKNVDYSNVKRIFK